MHVQQLQSDKVLYLWTFGSFPHHLFKKKKKTKKDGNKTTKPSIAYHKCGVPCLVSCWLWHRSNKLDDSNDAVKHVYVPDHSYAFRLYGRWEYSVPRTTNTNLNKLALLHFHTIRNNKLLLQSAFSCTSNTYALLHFFSFLSLPFV